LPAISKLEGAFESAYFTWLIFALLGHFCTFWPISAIFDPRFFLFSLFFHF
jgi:hypothetical protein